MKSVYISRTDFKKGLTSFLEKKWDIYAPFSNAVRQDGTADSILFERVCDPSCLDSIVFDSISPDQPIKSFFFYTKEKVSTLTKSSIDPVKFKKRILVGVSGCDLKALKVFDKAYYEEGTVPEPFYKARRESTYIISSDCGSFLDSCFCTLLGGKPYAQDGFDLNLSCIGDGFVVEVGSEKGEELLSEMKKVGATIHDASSIRLEEQEKKRKDLTKKLENANKEFDVPEKFDELCKVAFDSEVWKNLADSKCVQCNGCLNICPTCYCFLLYDKKKNDVSERIRIWDACINAGYARVAGGATPRPTLQSRLRHRFFHKFLYFVQNFDMFACSGCGRCAMVCPGKIEIRGTFKDIHKEKAGKKG